MRKFIISDIHGNGNLYYSVMSYIENISIYDDVTLYINGDLIDRGIDSAEILLDLINKINNKNNPFKIVYLGGNHEQLMYEIYQKRRKGIYVSNYNDWYNNGGNITDQTIEDLLEKDEILKVVDFIGNLELYHKFNEKINNKNIVLVHASSPVDAKDNCHLKIKDDEANINYLLWTRINDPSIPFRCRIGYKDYFTIAGHTPNNSKYGYIYDKDENYLNIDGGSAMYVSGYFEYNHYPLIEIKDNYLKILTFNNNNEIIYGNYFKDFKSIPFTYEELDNERKFLNKDLKIKKLIKLPNNIVGYEE